MSITLRFNPESLADLQAKGKDIVSIFNRAGFEPQWLKDCQLLVQAELSSARVVTDGLLRIAEKETGGAHNTLIVPVNNLD